jgi:hypothetical protein
MADWSHPNVVHGEDSDDPGWCAGCGCAWPCPWADGHTWWVQPDSGQTHPPRTSGPVRSGFMLGR